MSCSLFAGSLVVSEAAIWYGLRMLERVGGGVRQAIRAENAYERRLLSEVLKPPSPFATSWRRQCAKPIRLCSKWSSQPMHQHGCLLANFTCDAVA